MQMIQESDTNRPRQPETGLDKKSLLLPHE